MSMKLRITDTSLYKALAAGQGVDSAESQRTAVIKSLERIADRPEFDPSSLAPLFEQNMDLVKAISEKNTAPDMQPLIDALNNGMKTIALALRQAERPRSFRLERDDDGNLARIVAE
jgi:hypothetical protein